MTYSHSETVTCVDHAHPQHSPVAIFGHSAKFGTNQSVFLKDEGVLCFRYVFIPVLPFTFNNRSSLSSSLHSTMSSLSSLRPSCGTTRESKG